MDLRRSALVAHPAERLYTLIEAAEDYPKFLPWCAHSEVLAQHDDGMTARLTLAFSGVRHAFTTLNQHVADRSVLVGLVDGPFSLLDGHWQFLPLGDEAAASAPACKVELDLRYAFASSALEAVVSPVFDRIANTLVDSFVRRAEQVYGPR